MRCLAPLALVVSLGAVLFACGDDDASGGGASSGGTGTDGGGASSGGPVDPGSQKDGGIVDPTAIQPPPSTCTPPVTASDVSKADSTLGAPGGPACDEAGLQAALDKGGVITFSCGGTTTAPFVLTLTKELKVDKDVVIDGGGAVTLSGNRTTRILHVGHGDFESLSPNVIVQKLTFVDGHTTDVPSTKKTDQGGAAIYRLGGTLTVIDSKFVGNIGPTDGQDVAGGAIYSIGGGSTTILGSTFSGNRCSNGGALGNLGNVDLTVVNSTFTDNAATGKNANPGNGGNGGAISFDGPATTGTCAAGPYTPKTMSFCGAIFRGNSAGVKAFGGAIFRTVNTTCVPAKTAPTTIDRSTFDRNESGSAGALYMHQVDLTITASTFSGNVSRAGAGGAIWAEGSADGPADVTLNLTNTTVAGNTAKEALGGGFFIGAHVGGGEFRHVTVASNAVTTDSGNQYLVFGAGIVGDVSKVKLTSSVFADNKKPAPVSGDAANCQGGFIDGGGNLEFVSEEHPDPKRCVPGSTLEDPLLAALADNDGPTQTMALGAASPAIGKATTCSPTDQRGHPRKTPCAAGAFEP